MAAFQGLGAVATIIASTTSATCANLNTSAPGAYVCNRTGNWAFVFPTSVPSGAASIPLSTTTPECYPVPPNCGITIKHGGGNAFWAGILETGAASGFIHIKPSDGGE